MSPISRTDFISGNTGFRSPTIRPPWSLETSLFVDICNHCGDCIRACPTAILEFGRGKYPVVNYAEGECLFCEKCVQSCDSGAITKVSGSRPWELVAVIDEKLCLAHRNIECMSCSDPCETGAIHRQYQRGATPVPILEPETCTACGACLSRCPQQAIRIETLNEAIAA